MKRITSIVIMFIFLVILPTAYGFEHRKDGPDLTVTEQWSFSKDEVKKILIKHLIDQGICIPNMKNATSYIGIYAYDGSMNDESVVISVEYEP